MTKTSITRRDFLKRSSSAALAGALYLNLPARMVAQADRRSKVILIRDPRALNSDNEPADAVLEEMLDKAVTVLLDEDNVSKAWEQILQPEDILGIKTNIWSYLRVPPGLEQSIHTRAVEVGIKPKNISIVDRGVLSDPVFQKATALINIRPMRTHYWSGVGSLIKNYITFVKSPSSYHPDTCADLATLWKLPIVKGKTRLNILVMLNPLFHGSGPHHFNPKYTWPYKGLLVGTDPVAVDATGLRILTAKRREFFGDERPLTPPAKHILLADTRHHLGTADPGQIELIKLGWEEGILI
ncbi:DUF362 domain-containing protein [Candidatus Neomarinimicrobiota bacterium]